MRIFVDANVLVAVLLKEHRVYDSAANVLMLHGFKSYLVCTTTLALAIAFYFVGKRYGAQEAKRRIEILSQHIIVLPSDGEAHYAAMKDKSVLDYEDGLQYYAALSAGCSYLITFDTQDFHFSKIPVRTPDQFLAQH